MQRLPRLSQALSALQTLYPTQLAGSWDNVGLLVDLATSDDARLGKIFFCNDLVPRVLDEALDDCARDPTEATLIVTYHPTPFRGLKKITKGDNVGKMILRCAAAGVAVYSPHTGCDCAVGGVNDWLAEGMGLGEVIPITPSSLPGFAGAGEGRMLTLAESVSMNELTQRIKRHLKLDHVRVALAFNRFPSGAAAADPLNLDFSVTTVGICAGSGSSVLTGVSSDVWLTGELSHHEILAANAVGTTVVLTDHSNTERGYLPVMSELVSAEFRKQSLEIPDMVISRVDADPLVIV